MGTTGCSGILSHRVEQASVLGTFSGVKPYAPKGSQDVVIDQACYGSGYQHVQLAASFRKTNEKKIFLVVRYLARQHRPLKRRENSTVLVQKHPGRESNQPDRGRALLPASARLLGERGREFGSAQTKMSYLNEAEHVREGLVLLRGEIEAHLCVLLLPQRRAGEVLLHEPNHLLSVVGRGRSRPEEL